MTARILTSEKGRPADVVELVEARDLRCEPGRPDASFAVLASLVFRALQARPEPDISINPYPSLPFPSLPFPALPVPIAVPNQKPATLRRAVGGAVYLIRLYLIEPSCISRSSLHSIGSGPLQGNAQSWLTRGEVDQDLFKCHEGCTSCFRLEEARRR